MQKPEIWRLVLSKIAPTKIDPTSSDWRAYVSRYIVPEVRSENTRFFGNTDDHESQYPGLDYSNPGHRLRLEDFTHHRQLFAAFDKLKLTESELNTLCNWHGTRKARESFERKHNLKIGDTTWEGIHPFRFLQATVTIHSSHVSSLADQPKTVHADDEEMVYTENEGEEEAEGDDNNDDVSAIESEDELEQSVGVELNERLRASAQADVDARARGEAVMMDAQWEQWMKEAAERGLELETPLREQADPAAMQQWVYGISSISAAASQLPSQPRIIGPNHSSAQRFTPLQDQAMSAFNGILDDTDPGPAGAASANPLVEGH